MKAQAAGKSSRSMSKTPSKSRTIMLADSARGRSAGDRAKAMSKRAAAKKRSK